MARMLPTGAVLAVGDFQSFPFPGEMPEDFYAQWERLRSRERALWRRVQRTPEDCDVDAERIRLEWERAAERLTRHEQNFGA